MAHRGERILLLGGSGLLGTSLRSVLAARGLPFLAPSRRELDLASPPPLEAWLRARSLRAVLNAAAFTDVAAAEDPGRREEVFRLNRDLPEALAHACARLGLPLVHVSTDYVFDGRKGSAYTEEDPTGPVQAYGLSKLEGERRVLAECPDALVARTSTLYGTALGRRPHYVDAILRQAREGDSLAVAEPPVSSPTYAPDLAEAILDLLAAGARGIVHAANDGSCSRLELARAVVEEAGLAGRVAVRPRPPSPGGPKRPPCSALDTGRLASITGRRLRPWRVALAAHLAEGRA